MNTEQRKGVADRNGDSPASEMTKREAIAAQVFAARIASGMGPGASALIAVKAAEFLLQALEGVDPAHYG